METKVQKEISKKITRIKKGQILILSDFRGLGSEAAIRQALSRLCKKGLVKRIGHGIYFIPDTDPVKSKKLPSMETVAEAIAKKEHVRIKPAGANALHKLGLTTQVPMRLVYLTDGPLRRIKLGKTIVKFKPTTPKRLSLKGEFSSLIIQALEEIGTENLDVTKEQRIKELLKKEDQKILLNDMKLTSAKVSDYLFLLIRENNNDK